MKLLPSIFVSFLLFCEVLTPRVACPQASIPDGETWVTNGTVRAIVRTTDRIYLGGNFTHVGPNTGASAAFDASTGQPVAPFSRLEGTVHACVSDGAGGWYVGGAFTASFTLTGGEHQERIRA